MTEAPLREAEVIERLARALCRRKGLEAPGDDGALLRAADGRVIVTDTVVDGVHFRRDWSTLRDVAWRALSTNVSDVWAMRATPTAWLLSIASPGLTDGDVKELIAGFSGCIAALGVDCDLIGGDTTRAPSLVLTVTVLGQCVGAPLSRSGAAPGQGVYINGPVGHAAVGLAALQARRGSEFPSFVRAHRRPTPPRVHDDELATAQAGLDVSDGVAQDLWRLARASNVRIVLDALPTDAPLLSACETLGVSARHCQLFGGDDYVLAVTAEAAPGPGWALIGTVESCEEPELTEVCHDGTRRAVPAGGFHHFHD